MVSSVQADDIKVKLETQGETQAIDKAKQSLSELKTKRNC